MSVTVKACLLGRYEQVKEIRRFPVDQHVYRSFDNLRRKTAAVFSNLKNSSFSLFYKGEPRGTGPSRDINLFSPKTLTSERFWSPSSPAHHSDDTSCFI
uniref:Uncharacterized protein n=1 Tax=Oryzias melastigma TaxID=30732 RepID=A0A3B3BMW0_ORYME